MHKDNIIDFPPGRDEKRPEPTDEEMLFYLAAIIERNLLMYRTAFGGRLLEREEAQKLFMLIAENTCCDLTRARVLCAAMDDIFLRG